MKRNMFTEEGKKELVKNEWMKLNPVWLGNTNPSLIVGKGNKENYYCDKRERLVVWKVLS